MSTVEFDDVGTTADCGFRVSSPIDANQRSTPGSICDTVGNVSSGTVSESNPAADSGALPGDVLYQLVRGQFLNLFHSTQPRNGT